MPKPQPTFTAEFKHEAVQLAQTSGKPKAQIARELGISDSVLYTWCKQAEEHGIEAFPGKGHQTPLEEENHRLKREPSHHSREDATLAEKIQEVFQCHRCVYGSPRIHAELQAQGIHCARKRVARLMREQELVAKRPRHHTVTTQSEDGATFAPNLLQQD